MAYLQISQDWQQRETKPDIENVIVAKREYKVVLEPFSQSISYLTLGVEHATSCNAYGSSA
jgi:hypothetical protein